MIKRKLLVLITLCILILINSSHNGYSLDSAIKYTGVKAVHESGITGKGNTICLIDGGLYYQHPKLSGCVGSSCRILATYNAFNDSNNIDSDNHGTWTAGVIISNDTKYRGVAYGSNLVFVEIVSFLNVSKAIKWCVDNKNAYNITAISMSMSVHETQTNTNCLCRNLSCGGTGYIYDYFNISPQVEYANNNKITVLFSAGNQYQGYDVPYDSPVTESANYPACLPKVIAVGNVDDNDKFSPSSNRKGFVNLVAPGENIITTHPGGDFSYLTENVIKKYLCRFNLANCGVSGTSFSTPYLAGIIALIREYDTGIAEPSYIYRILNLSGVKIYDPPSNKNYSRVDLTNLFNLYDWPTDHHDFRRTGFTLLKGDVNKASDIDASNIALKDSVTSDIIIRPSVSDLDNNGHQDVVTIIHPLGDSGSDVYAVERSKKWYAPWQMETKPKWHLSIPISYPLLPPTLANIDSDAAKEVLVGLENGTLIAYDITSGGQDQDAVEKWRYKFAAKYSAEANTTFVRFGGGSAVGDIDLDGNYEVITADMGSRGTPDWPGEVFIIDGATGTKEGNATFGNGGAFASLFIAKTGGDAL